MFNKLVRNLFSIIKHLLVVGVILAAFFPLAKLYYQSYPPYGVDFYQFVNFAAYIKKHLSWPLFSWKHTWFSGHPTYFDYGLLHSYLTLPLMNFFSVVNASRIYLLGTLAAYIIFTYFLFYQLTKNRLFSFLLAIYLTWTPNLYTALFSGGTAGYSATQMFLPLVLFLIVKYFKSRSKRFLLLGSLALGLSFWGHAGVALFLIVIPAFLVLFFWIDDQVKFISWTKIKNILLFFIPAFLLASFPLYPVLYPIIYWARETMSGYVGLDTRVYPGAFVDFLASNNHFLFGLLIAGFLINIITERLKGLKKSSAFLALSFYFLFFHFLFFIGRNPIGNAIGPGRTFFAFTLSLACLLAAWWPVPGKKAGKLVNYLRSAFIVLLVIVLYPGFYRQDYLKMPTVHTSVIPPEINKALVYNDRAILAEITPAWFNTRETNFRFYEASNSVNLWWNIVFDLSMVKGCYYTGTSQYTANWLYWADLTFIGEIVEHFNTPEAVAKNSALFLLDWYAVKYFDSHPAPYGLAPYLLAEPGLVKNRVEGNGKAEFIEIGDNFTTPIVRPVNSPNLLVITNDGSYDVFLRVLGMENLNSRYLIPLHGPDYLDEIEKDELSNFDAILLYDYQYENRRVWNLLEEYVKNGGRLIIETGAEVKESDLANLPGVSELPSVFPVKKTRRDQLGNSWNLIPADNPALSEVQLDDFGPLVYETAPWKLSFAEPGDVRAWAKTILSQNGKPILAAGNLGQGKVIWSGINLPYHIKTYLNFEESRLFRNLLEAVLDMDNQELDNYQVVRPRPENIKITAENYSGVLFKENNFKGWRADNNLKIYNAGLDYIYIRVPKGTRTVNLNFRGAMISWVLFSFGLLSFLFYLIYLIFGGQIFEKIIIRFGVDKKIKKIKKWWSKEDE